MFNAFPLVVSIWRGMHVANLRAVCLHYRGRGAAQDTHLPVPSWSSTMSTRPTSPVPSCFSRRNCDSARRPFLASAAFSASQDFSCACVLLPFRVWVSGVKGRHGALRRLALHCLLC